MMGILDLQKQTRELGRIRIGEQVKTATGSRPGKLTKFRFTTNSQPGAEAIAALYGGEVKRAETTAQEFEVYSDVDVLAVSIPPGDGAVSQWWELWTAGGCQRRCDGFNEQTKQVPCLCPVAGPLRTAAAARGDGCKPTTRVNVILPDLPDLGVWRYESHGYYAAVEMAGTAELLAQARSAGQIIPASMRIEQREVIRPDRENKPQTRRFPVVVLEVGSTLRQLVEASGAPELAASLPADPTIKSIEAPHTPGSTPTPPVVEPGPDVAVAGRGKGKPAPAAAAPIDKPITTPQELADAARAATSAARLSALATLCNDNGWRAEMVTDASDVAEELFPLLSALRDQLLGAAS